MKITAIILAGGKSRRLGRNKALELLDGRRLIDHTIERIRKQASQILIVTSREQFDVFNSSEAEIVADIYPDKGPFGGIYTGLLAARFPRSLVVACDMPFLNDNLLSYMIQIYLSSDSDLVIPRLSGMVEPLHAIYSKSYLTPIESLLEQDRLSVLNLLTLVNVRYVEIDEIRKFDSGYSSFFNINIENDLVKAV